MKVKIHPPDNWIEQQPYCCVPVCVQIILDRRKLLFPDQETISIDLGLIMVKRRSQKR